jgi:hypothetical protein
MHMVDPELRRVAREASPGKSWDWWLVQDLINDDMVVPLETAPDDMVLSQADWFEHEEYELEYARWLRAFVRWRKRHRSGLTLVWTSGDE